MRTQLITKTLASATLVLLASNSYAALPNDASDTIKVDGSSTVYPITEAVAEDFGKQYRKIKVTVGISGTGGGFKQFCRGETDISDASRPIKQTEIELCKENGIEYVELPVAFDALSVVVNKENDFANSLTVAELKKLWAPEAKGKITKWSQIRPGFPDEKIQLYGPGVDSGTFDYFTEAIVGTAQASRSDFTSSEDDNVLVQGVANNKYALGFFGMAYYIENQNKLKALAIDDEDNSNGAGPQMPTIENVEKGLYQPLARPLFIYVGKKAVERPAIKEFVSYYLKNAATLSSEVGYVKLPKDVYQLATNRFEKLVPGSIYASGNPQHGMTLAELLK